MNVLRRAWRVLVAPPQSLAASYFMSLIAIWSAAIAFRAVAGWEWPPQWDRLVYVAWAYVALWIVRELDEERAENARLKQELSTYKIAIQYAPFVVELANRRRAEKARDANR